MNSSSTIALTDLSSAPTPDNPTESTTDDPEPPKNEPNPYALRLSKLWRHISRAPCPPQAIQEEFPCDSHWLQENLPVEGFGMLPFSGENKAMYVCVGAPKGSNVKQIGNKLVETMMRAGFSLPRLLISVTGGARDFELSPQLELVLKRGLRQAALITNAWIVTGGTDCGIMKYVGDAMGHIRGSADEAGRIPVIGIATLPKVFAADKLRKGKGQELPGFADSDGSKGAKLNCNHTHFFLVDTGIDDYGEEVAVKNAFEEAVVARPHQNVRAIVLRLPVRFVGAFANLATPEARAALEQQLTVRLGLHAPASSILTLQIMASSSVTTRLVKILIQYQAQLPPSVTVDSYLSSLLVESSFEGLEKEPVSVCIPGELPPKLVPDKLTDGDREIFHDATKTYAVLLVVEGGPVTLQVVSEAVYSRVPVVVIEGSGRVADLIALAWRYLHDANRMSSNITRVMLIEGLRDVFPRDLKKMPDKDPENDAKYEASLQERLRSLLQVVTMRHRITTYSLDEGKDIDDSILTAMLLSAQPRQATPEMRFEDQFRKLQISLLFKQADRATTHLVALRALVSPAKKAREYASIVKDALLWSLSSDLLDFVKLFTPEVTDMCAFLFEEKNTVIWQLYTRARAPYFDALFKSTTGHTYRVRDRADGLDDERLILNHVDTMLVALLNPGLRAIKREKSDFEDLKSLPRDVKREVAFQELLVWAILMNRQNLAEFFWQCGGHSIANALMCALLLLFISSNPLLQHRAPEIANGMRLKAAVFEELAIGVLNSCFEESVDKATQILAKPLTPLRWLRKINNTKEFMNTIDLAYSARARNFLSHTAAQEVVAVLWHGQMLQQSVGQIALLLVMPWHVPLKLNKETTDSYQDDTGEDAFLKPPYVPSLRCFYSAPVTKFLLDAMCVVVLLFLYCSIVLNKLPLAAMSGAEVILAIWMFALVVERLRIVATIGTQLWLQNSWNTFDICTYLLYLCAFAVRLHSLKTQRDADQIIAKGLYAINLMIIFLGVCRLYAVSHKLGPKLIVVYKMMGNFMTFLAFYAVVMLAYGIAIQSLLFPSLDVDNISIVEILYRPFFQLFGELMLDQMQQDGQCVGLFPFTNCGSMAVLVVPLLAFYLIVSNIMLINLLIAMLSSTYSRIEASSIELWRFQFYELVQDYGNRALLPGPLSLFENMYYFFTMARRTAAWAAIKHALNQKKDQYPVEPVVTDSDALEQFQERHTDLYIDARRAKERQALEVQIAQMAKTVTHVDIISAQVDEILRRLDTQHTSIARAPSLGTSSRPFATRIAGPAFMPTTPAAAAPADGSLLAMVDPDTVMLAVPRLMGSARPFALMTGLPAYVLSEASMLNTKARSRKFYPVWERALLSQALSLVADTMPPLARTTIPTREGSAVVLFGSIAIDKPKCAIPVAMFAVEENLPPTMLAAQAMNHKGIIVTRREVPDSGLDWDAPSSVEAPYYVSPSVLIASAMTDPCLTPARCGTKCTCPKKFANAETEAPAIPNPSFLPPELLRSAGGLPLNPFGRTGLRGRGALFKWGANQALDQIVTRWVRDPHGGIVQRGGRPLAQVLAIRRRVDGLWALPGSFVRPAGTPLPVVAKVFGVSSSDSERLRFKTVNEFLTQGTSIFQGYMDDPRNTDNAWVETDAVHCHDETDFLSAYPLLEPTYDDVSDAVIDVAWLTIHSDVELAFSHTLLVQRAAERLGAFWAGSLTV